MILIIRFLEVFIGSYLGIASWKDVVVPFCKFFISLKLTRIPFFSHDVPSESMMSSSEQKKEKTITLIK
jgi:hypothetical protein